VCLVVPVAAANAGCGIAPISMMPVKKGTTSSISNQWAQLAHDPETGVRLQAQRIVPDHKGRGILPGREAVCRRGHGWSTECIGSRFREVNPRAFAS